MRFEVRKMFYFLLLLIVCSSEGNDFNNGLQPPSIYLNSDLLLNQTDVLLSAHSAFNLSCHGNGSVLLSTTSFRSISAKDFVRVRKSEPRHTGTYRCGYTNRSLQHLDTWIHVYVKDPSDPFSVFVTPRGIHDFKEGEDYLFRCLLTDPSVTNLTLQSVGKVGGRGRGLPQGMNVTFDPRRGALIHQLQQAFNGRYVCSGWRNGSEFLSKPIDLWLYPSVSHPPSLHVSQEEFVRLVGEKFEVTCVTSNPTHYYTITWTHPHIQVPKITGSHRNTNRLYKNSTLTVDAVSLSHSGPYTCTAVNEAGVATATAQLKVVDRPYLRIYLQPHANANTRTIQVNGTLIANVSSSSIEGSWDMIANMSANGTDANEVSTANVSSRVESYVDEDVTLSFAMEAYPPITNHRWVTPMAVKAEYQQSYTVNGYRSVASLQLRQVRQEARGRYSLHLSNSFFSGLLNIDLRILRSASAVVTVENDTLTCSSSGYPPPSILWNTCIGVKKTCGDLSTDAVPSTVTSEEEEEEELRTHLPLPLPLSPGEDVTVECVAYNTVGLSRQIFVFHSAREAQTSALIGALSAAAVLLLLLMFVCYKLKQKPKYEIRWKIIESTDGNNYTFVDPNQLPYNLKWEFPRDKLRLGAVVGSGAFGKVVEATAYGLGTNDVTRVAVKMLKSSAHSEERDALMSELKILSYLGYHDNIVNLLGACTRGGPMLMITEYCCHGDLLNFLRARAQDIMASIMNRQEAEVFYRNMTSAHIRIRSDSGISCCSEYQEMKPMLSEGQKHPDVQTDGLSVDELMRFSYQVAQGMDFLATRNCIHRDVAARNVLLTDHHVAKICDFGLARDIRNDDSYIVQGNARLPVKWMAPESIFQCVYTVQSDVWSYGVLLWEIFSLGKSPYPSIAVDTNFYKMIQDGYHMAQPDFASAEMYQLMTRCWSLEPTDRPTFKTIGQLINRLLPATTNTPPHQSDQSTYKNIEECREEEEEVRSEDGLKEDRGHCEENKEVMRKNIYQLC